MTLKRIETQHQSIRHSSCCPAFIIGLSGPYLTICGAVFADRLICQHLTDSIYLGPCPRLDDRLEGIAKILQILKGCLKDLDKFYSDLEPQPAISRYIAGRRERSTGQQHSEYPSSGQSSFQFFRHFVPSSGSDMELEYLERLVPENPEKSLFKASA
jgi:hypothetical protein